MTRDFERFMRLALRLARRGYGATSPNPMVGAVLVKDGRIIGRGWHRRAGEPHAEIEALRDAERRGHDAADATLFVTLEPCGTQGRTPPCTQAIIAAGIKHVIAAATDPNPRHRGKGFGILKRAGIRVTRGVLAEPAAMLNEAFNHWIVHRTPLVTVKAAMTLDGKTATAAGASKWITGELARSHGMKLRQGADAILVGINTVLADDPSLTVRNLAVGGQMLRDANPDAAISFSPSPPKGGAGRGEEAVCLEARCPSPQPSPRSGGERELENVRGRERRGLRRIVLDARARTPLRARVVNDELAALTTIVVSRLAPKRRVAALAKRVRVLTAPLRRSGTAAGARAGHPAIDVGWLLKRLGAEEVTHLLVEGGGEVNASFLLGGLAQRIAFFYAPKVLGGRQSRRAVAGDGATSLSESPRLSSLQWRRLGPDWLLTARVRKRRLKAEG
jgi:diaminohydroxyphosphoribosylaminopyrimidine deaminase/5-amino-6-(5-phosphoribosylamino)uracil reductase